MLRRSFLACLLFLLCCSVLTPQAEALSLTNVTVTGNQLTAEIRILFLVSADLTITFDQVTNLSAGNLGLSVALVLPSDVSFLARLPDGLLTTLVTAFPVRVILDPPVNGGLAFSGTPDVEFNVHVLSYTVNTPLRLFAAMPSGTFYEVSESMGPGSYHVIGRKPEFFGEYVILADTRQVDNVARDKQYWLEETLTTNSSAIEPQVYSQLASLTATSRAAVDDERPGDAATTIATFMQVINAHRGEDIPNEWDSSREQTNVAADLEAIASTLHFSLLKWQESQNQ